MPKEKIDEDDKYKIELIYKNLEYISRAYFSAEQIFPLWEAIYALIAGQLLVAFFTVKHTDFRGSIAIAGMIFSVFWFLVINTSFTYSRERVKKFGKLEMILEAEYNKIRLKLPRNSNFKFYGLMSSSKKSMLKTWSLRKLTPATIFALWVYLMWRSSN